MGGVTDFFGGSGGDALLNEALPAVFTSGGSVMDVANVPARIMPGQGGLPMPRGITRFPLLAGAMLEWRRRGIALTIEKLWSLARRFGPNFLVTAGILSVGALTELMLSRGTKRHRRMNPLNPKALSRSIRRLAGFERRAARVSAQLGRVARRRKTTRRCMTCRKSPCCC
jgi:hypothetical protein